MFKILLPALALALYALPHPTQHLQPKTPQTEQALAVGEQRSIASLMPPDSLLYVEAPGLSEVLEAGLEHPLLQNILESELGMRLVDRSGISLEQKLKFVDALFGEPVLPVLQRACSEGVAFSLSLRHGLPATLIAMHSSDPQSTRKSLERVFQLAAGSGFVAASKPLGEADMWSLKNGAVLVQSGALYLLASSEDLAREGLVLARRADPAGLACNAGFKKLMNSEDHKGTLRAWINCDALAAADPKKFEWMQQLQRTPQGQLLLGAGLSTLSAADALGASLNLAAAELQLEIWAADTKWLAPLGPQHADQLFERPAPLAGIDALGQALLYRDLETFLAERPQLLLARELPGVSEALTNISLFFGGMDIGEEISPDVSPWVQLISTELKYEYGPIPDVQFPGLALIAELRNPQLSGPRWNTAFQSLIGILNIDAAQKKGGKGSMLLGLGLEGATVISLASYPSPAPGEPVDARFNLRPSCCVVGGRLVIGTHEDLVRQIVRGIQAEQPKEHAADSRPLESLNLRAAPIERLVRGNFDTLVMNKVVDEGVSFEKATEDLSGVALALRALQKLELSIDYTDPEAIVARLRLGLQPKASRAR